MLQYCNNVNNKNTGNEKYKTKIRIKQTTYRRKKKNRKKNFSFRRFLLFLRFSVGKWCCDVIPDGGPEARSRGICLQILDIFLRQTCRLHDCLHRQVHRFHRLCNSDDPFRFAGRQSPGFTFGKTGGMPFFPCKVDAVPVIVFSHHIVSV